SLVYVPYTGEAFWKGYLNWDQKGDLARVAGDFQGMWKELERREVQIRLGIGPRGLNSPKAEIAAYRTTRLGVDRQSMNHRGPEWRSWQKSSRAWNQLRATRPTGPTLGRAPWLPNDEKPFRLTTRVRPKKLPHKHDCPTAVLQLQAPGHVERSNRVQRRSEWRIRRVDLDPCRNVLRVHQLWRPRAASPGSREARAQSQPRPRQLLRSALWGVWQRCAVRH